MEQFRLVITMDTGETIFGCQCVQGKDEADSKNLGELLEGINDMEYLSVQTPKGKVFLPKGMIQRSHFLIENLG